MDCKHCQQWCQMESWDNLRWNALKWIRRVVYNHFMETFNLCHQTLAKSRYARSIQCSMQKCWPYIKGAEIYILWFLYIKENAPSPYFGPVLCGKTADKKTRCYKFTPNTYKNASLKTVLTSETRCIWSNIKYVFKLSVYSHSHSGFR